MSDQAPVGPVAGTKVPRFAGDPTFARLPRIDAVNRYDIAVLGAPFDAGTSYRPGARFGPIAVRTASRHLRPAYHQELGVQPYQTLQVVDAGDVSANPFSITAALESIQGHASDVLANGSRLITIGGDHTVALPLLRATRARQGPVALVHFDAHLDTWNTYFGTPVTHGTVFRRAFEEGLLIEDHSIHVGIRGPVYDAADLAEQDGFGFKVVRAVDLDQRGFEEVADLIRRRVGACPVYVSIDVDVLDPAFAPGTGTPEMGGFTSRELLRLLRSLDGLAIVGADVVEVSPPYDVAEITALAAATLVYDLTSLMAKRASDCSTQPGVATTQNG